MFISNAKIYGFTRINQNSINTLEVNFNKVMQLILGGNGSGKSSILELFSGFPPNSADFVKDGGVERTIEHNGSIFKIHSDQDKGHYFEKDGEILNNWGTGQVQKSLVEIHLGLDKSAWDVISGLRKFTDMSNNERRYWVMRLSNLDIDPLMAVFENAKQQHRDVKGHLSKISERLKVEVKNTVSEDNIIELKNQLTSLKDEFNYYSKFSEETKGNTNNKEQLEIKSKELIDFMERVMANYPEVPQWLIKQGVKCPDDISHVITDRSARLALIKEQHIKAMGDLKEINKIALAKASLEKSGVKESEDKINQLQSKIDALSKKVSDNFDYLLGDVKAHTAKNDYLRIVGDLRTTIFELPSNDEYKFNSHAFDVAMSAEIGLTNRLTDVKESIFKREHLLEHFDKADEIVCPSCTYSFKQGFSKHDIAKASDELTSFKQTRDDLIKRLEELREFKKDCGEYISQIKNIYSTMRLTPSNEMLWVKVKALEIFKGNKGKVLELLDDHLRFLDIVCEIEETQDLLDRESDICLKAKESLKLVENVNTDNISKIDEEVYRLANEINYLEDTIFKASSVKARFDDLENKLQLIEAKLDDFNIMFVNELDNERALFIKKTKFDIMKEINMVEQELEQAKTKNLIFKDVEVEHARALAEYNEYGIIVNNLSPNTGLIADLLNDKIQQFVSNLNEHIASVWTSELSVLPCINKKNDLDWKFPVRVEAGLVRPDISKTSTSQKDIINLAFMLRVIRHLGVGNYPICLDELGSHMDEQHRINITAIIEELKSSGYCSQVFFISHHAAFHELFKDAETLIINTKNLVNLPKVYNQHVRIS